MRISTMACHALHLLLCLSEQSDDIPASASELAVCTGISEKFVQKIMIPVGHALKARVQTAHIENGAQGKADHKYGK